MIAAESLCFGYTPETPALRDVSIRIAPGEVVGIVGLNGAGKSTLLAALLGLVEPSQGTITIDGTPLEKLGVFERARRIGAVLQREQTIFPYAAIELVRLGRHAHRGRFAALTSEDTAAIARALAAVDATHLADRLVTELSGGERQRILLARALAQETPYLALDEPTAFLDLPHQLALGALVQKLSRERGVGVAWVLHDLNLAVRFCDRIAALDRGALAFTGPAATALDEVRLRNVFRLDAELHKDSRGAVNVLFHGAI